ncbi:BnaC05g00900D [Brassica napus]|uniref:Protein ARV n=1 Tax=Brassica napus TaxID=3708 RepID=A0A078FQ01_BRANA|nr:BnaC05g00900D [Brassica napus]
MYPFVSYSFGYQTICVVSGVLVDILTTNLAFIFSFAIAAKGLLNEVSRKREIFLGILISSYFKIFLLAMLVCMEFPVSVIFIMDILVLTSNSMALKGQTFNY